MFCHLSSSLCLSGRGLNLRAGGVLQRGHCSRHPSGSKAAQVCPETVLGGCQHQLMSPPWRVLTSSDVSGAWIFASHSPLGWGGRMWFALFLLDKCDLAVGQREAPSPLHFHLPGTTNREGAATKQTTEFRDVERRTDCLLDSAHA